MNTDPTHNAVLKEAFEAEAEQELARYFPSEPQHYSPKFEKRMKRLIRRDRLRTGFRLWLEDIWAWIVDNTVGEWKRTGPYARKRCTRQAAVMMVLLILTTFTGSAPPPISYSNADVRVNQMQGWVQVVFDTTPGYVYPESLEWLYLLRELPDEYHIVLREVHSDEQTVRWCTDRGGWVQLTQVTFPQSVSFFVDGYTVQDVTVKGNSGLLFHSGDYTAVAWYTDYVFLLEVVDPNLSAEQVLALTQNLLAERREPL